MAWRLGLMPSREAVRTKKDSLWSWKATNLKAHLTASLRCTSTGNLQLVPMFQGVSKLECQLLLAVLSSHTRSPIKGLHVFSLSLSLSWMLLSWIWDLGLPRVGRGKLACRHGSAKRQPDRTGTPETDTRPPRRIFSRCLYSAVEHCLGESNPSTKKIQAHCTHGSCNAQCRCCAYPMYPEESDQNRC